MSYLERVKSQAASQNLYLVRRVETASGYGPLSRSGVENFNRILRAAGKAASWEDLPEADRRIVEESERARDRILYAEMAA